MLISYLSDDAYQKYRKIYRNANWDLDLDLPPYAKATKNPGFDPGVYRNT
jgi:hypothetical protein